MRPLVVPSGRNVKRVDNERQQQIDKWGDVSPISRAQSTPTSFHDPYQALRFRDFRLLFAGTFISTFRLKAEQLLR
jgi:hypothetical protein